MIHLFTPEGEAALRAIVQRRPLLALDFDGTLAPIVPVPDQARAPLAITRVLEKLSSHLPIAIISGRSVADVSSRLEFTPRYVVGNHGMEGLPGSDPQGMHRQVQKWFEALTEYANQFSAAGILLENKGCSLSLHYRLARDQTSAQALIAQAVASLEPSPQQLGGKCVLNLIPPGAPDKFDAIAQLLPLAGCDCAIFVGDDLTDDRVFEKAPGDWLTVRIEMHEGHQARFHLNHQSEMALFLQRLLAAMP